MDSTTSVRATRHTAQDIAAAQDPDALLTVHTVATLTGYSVKTIREKSRTGDFPAPIHMGTGAGAVRWRAGILRAWLQSRGVMPPAG